MVKNEKKIFYQRKEMVVLVKGIKQSNDGNLKQFIVSESELY